MINKFFALLVGALSLTACTSTPSHLIIAPEIIVSSPLQFDNKQAQLNIVDMRTANHIVQILREGEAATLFSAQQSLENTIAQTLTTQWQKQGLNILPAAVNNIEIRIEKAVISVEQQALQYQSQSEIMLQVEITHGSKTLTSTFTNRGNSKGPLKADIAVLERNFNQRLASLLTQILASEKINQFIQ